MTLTLTALPIGTRLRTRDGRSARLLATDILGEFPCAVAVDMGGYEIVMRVTTAGFEFDDAEGDYDIVAIEEPTDA
jgi:hypothetical protein